MDIMLVRVRLVPSTCTHTHSHAWLTHFDAHMGQRVIHGHHGGQGEVAARGQDDLPTALDLRTKVQMCGGYYECVACGTAVVCRMMHESAGAEGQVRSALIPRAIQDGKVLLE